MDNVSYEQFPLPGDLIVSPDDAAALTADAAEWKVLTLTPEDAGRVDMVMVGALPNPRKPQLVRDVHGNELKDLFQFFPDLPRPWRRPARLPAKRTRPR